MRVLIVDDSVVYRSKIRAALERVPEVEVVGVASNGKSALDWLSQKQVDLITLDMEMPVMDGLQTLRELRKLNSKAKVVVFSSSTVRGSEATMDALALGADDFVAKPNGVSDEGSPEEIILKQLLPKIQQFLPILPREKPMMPVTPVRATPTPTFRRDISVFRPEIIVIASSTGGPTALESILTGMGGELRCPILIAQHMPPVFTGTFAKRMNEFSSLPCHEGRHQEPLKNQIYLAPGDYHLCLKRVENGVSIILNKEPLRNSVRPAADFLFESAAEIFGSKCMSFILTGMGEDGLAGAKAVRSRGGGVMIQDRASCVVFGMPGAAFAADAFDAMGSLNEIRTELKRMALA